MNSSVLYSCGQVVCWKGNTKNKNPKTNQEQCKDFDSVDENTDLISVGAVHEMNPKINTVIRGLLLTVSLQKVDRRCVLVDKKWIGAKVIVMSNS